MVVGKDRRGDARQMLARMLLFGEEDHPEVKGLLSYAKAGAHVFGSMEELADLLE